VRSDEIARLLPDVFQAAHDAPATGGVEADRTMGALLGAMEELHAPVESVLDHLGEHLNPLLAPIGMVTYLTSWVDLDRMVRQRSPGLGPLGVASDRLRRLVAAASEISGLRGTAKGMVAILEIATGSSGFTVEENVTGDRRVPRDDHLRIVGPATAQPLSTLVEEIVRTEKPAHVTYELAFATGGGEATEASEAIDAGPS
jgi:phage tail-like protein